MAKLNPLRVYADACCFSEVASYSEGVHNGNRKLDILFFHALMHAALDGKVEIVTSTLTIAECQYVGGSKNKVLTNDVKRLFRAVLCSNNVVVLAQPTVLVCEKAQDLRWVDGLSFKGADAVHVATAIKTGCTEFITHDDNSIGTHDKKKALLKEFGLTVVHPRDTKALPQEYVGGGGLFGPPHEQHMQAHYASKSFVSTSVSEDRGANNEASGDGASQDGGEEES